MAKNIYHHQQATLRNEKIRAMLRGLPASCSDYFRSISQTTSSLTRLAYAYDIRLFFQYLVDEHVSFANSCIYLITIEQISTITAREIEGFQEYLMQYAKHDSDQTTTFVQNNELGIMRKLCSLRSFFDYLFRNKLIPANVATLVPLPKRREKPILYLEKNEVQRMIDAISSGNGLSDRQKAYLSATRARDLAICMLFLGTGIRVSELVGLNLDDVDMDQNAFLVTRKGGNQTILYFSNAVKSPLQDYLNERAQIQPLPGHEDALFLSLQKRRVTTRAIENLVKKYAEIAAPLKKKISPHKLRSTFGTSLYEETGDIYLVADALGHADVNTTRKHYAAMTDERKREAAKRIPLPKVLKEQ